MGSQVGEIIFLGGRRHRVVSVGVGNTGPLVSKEWVVDPVTKKRKQVEVQRSAKFGIVKVEPV